MSKNKGMKAGLALQLSILTGLMMAGGCDRHDSTAAGNATNQGTFAAATRDSVVQGKDELVAAAGKKLKDLDAKLDTLNARAADLKDDAKARADEALAAVREERNLAAAKYAELKAAGQDTWEKARTGFAAAWTNVETAYENAKAKFN